jgi:hypothetical protein
MKISSQLANNFDYCSAEVLTLGALRLALGAFLCALRASALKIMADPFFGGSAVKDFLIFRRLTTYVWVRA